MAVVLDHDAAAARGDDDRLDIAIDVRPPRVDVALDDGERARLAAQVVRQRAAAASARHAEKRNADPVEHARHRGVDARRQGSLHATVQHEHPAPMPRGGPCAGCARVGNRCAEPRGQHRFQHAADRERAAEERARQQAFADQPAHGPRGERARRTVVDDVPADVDEAPVSHARRTRGLAAAAGEAAIEMHPRRCGDLLALERLLDEVDASARTVEIVAQQLVGRAGRRAEAAVDARAQDRVRFATLGRVADEIGERGLHVSVPARPPEGHCAPPRGAANTRPKAAGQPKAGPREAGCGFAAQSERGGRSSSEIGIEPAAVENARRIERRLEPAMQLRAPRPAADERHRPTCRRRGTASRGRRCPAPSRGPPRGSVRGPATSQRNAPPHSISCSPPRSRCGAVDLTESRQSGAPVSMRRA